MRFKLTCLAGVLALAGSAQASFFTHYNVTLADGSPSVNGIVKYEAIGNDIGVSWPDFLTGAPPGSGSSVGGFDQVFGSALPRTSALLLGVGYDNTYDRVHFVDEIPTQQIHTVMFVSTTAASAFASTPWATLFPDPAFNEAAISHAIEVYGIRGDQDPDWAAATALLDSFANTIRTGVTVGVNNNVFPWFDIPQVGQTPVDFSVIEFSSGVGIGSGAVNQASDTPEPVTGVLLVSALGAFVLVRRKLL